MEDKCPICGGVLENWWQSVCLVCWAKENKEKIEAICGRDSTSANSL